LITIFFIRKFGLKRPKSADSAPKCGYTLGMKGESGRHGKRGENALKNQIKSGVGILFCGGKTVPVPAACS